MSATYVPVVRASGDRLRDHHVRVAWLVFAVGVALVIGWPIAIVVNWHDIVSSHARLGYLIADLGLVVPLCFASWQGLLRNAPWGPGVLLVALGAGAYDVVHFTVYLIQVKELLPAAAWVVIGAGIVATLGWLAFWEIVRLRPQAQEG
jgi:hypothetical protein